MIHYNISDIMYISDIITWVMYLVDGFIVASVILAKAVAPMYGSSMLTRPGLP